MPNGHDYSKEYGPHNYQGIPTGTSDCEYSCGCWMGRFQSGGPLGLDPLGECPNNPIDGKRQDGNIDYEIVVVRRIRRLEKKAYDADKRAESLAKVVETDKVQMAEDLEVTQMQLKEARRKLEEIKAIIDSQ